MKSRPYNRRLPSNRVRLVAGLLLCLLIATPSFAQESGAFLEDSSPDRGFYPGGSYSISDIESINVVSGGLTLNLPLASLPPGRGGFSAGVNLIYNSSIWDQDMDFDSREDQFQNPVFARKLIHSQTGGGWNYGYQWGLILEHRPRPPDTCTGVTNEDLYAHKLLLVGPDGSRRTLHMRGENDFFNDGYYRHNPRDKHGGPCFGTANIPDLQGSTLTYYTDDGSYLKVEIPVDPSNPTAFWEQQQWTIYFPDGRRALGTSAKTQSIIDRNGNQIDIVEYDCGGGTTSARICTDIADDVNRKVTIDRSQASPKTHEIRREGFDGADLVTKVKWTTVSQNPITYPCAPGATDENCDISTFHSVVYEVELPNVTAALKYEFDYASTASVHYGELKKVTLPSGASASYEYEMEGSFKPDYDLLGNPVVMKKLDYNDEHDGMTVARQDMWEYEYDNWPAANTQTSITNPDGGIVTHHFYSVNTPTNPLHGLVWKVVQPNGDAVERYWQQNRPHDTGAQHPGNPYVRAEYRTVGSKKSAQRFTLDKNGNTTEVLSYDWGATGNSTSEPGGTVLRKTTNEYYAATAGASSTADEANAYWHPHALPNWSANDPRLLGAVKQTQIFDGGTVVGRTQLDYDGRFTKGNPTSEIRGITGDPPVSIQRVFDTYGNITQETDPRGTITKLTYDTNNLYPTKTEVAFGTSVERTTDTEYDFDTGLTTKQTGADNSVVTDFDYDALGRPTETVEASNHSAVKRKTTTEYNDAARTIRTRSDLDSFGDGKLVTVTHFDQLGSARLTRTTDGTILTATNEDNGIKVQSRHLVSGSNTYQLVSNPFRASTSPEAGSGTDDEDTMGWTRTKFDRLGRVVEVETFSGEQPPAPWGSNNTSTGVVTSQYNSDQTTVTEQAGKTRRSTVDGLRRLIKVEEDPFGSLKYETDYQYDALDNLTRVDQRGNPANSDPVQTRTFDYDGLSRLTSAFNPESTTTTYTYDPNGNLLTRTDARGTVTTNTYDALNRLTATSHAHAGGTVATPTTRYCYDGQTWNGSACSGSDDPPNVGQHTHVHRDLSDTEFSYDQLGRVVTSQQNTDPPDGTARKSYLFAYEYNRADGLTKQTNPSGRELTYGYDDAGRIDDADGLFDGTTTPYASSFTYAAHGAVQELKLGNNLYDHSAFNPRLQPKQIGLGSSSGATDKLQLDFTYEDPVTDNNGNVLTQTIDAPGLPAALTQDYSYDDVNRLTGISEGGWSRTYTYDPYGNRAADGAAVAADTPKDGDFEPSNNRLKTGWADYDLSGNLERFKIAGYQWTASYDADNKQTAFCPGAIGACSGVAAGSKTTYDYDGHGNRVRKIFENDEKSVYVYNAFGSLVAEYTDFAPTGPTGTQYRTTDHLGSTRIVTDATLAPNTVVLSRRDFFPFGEEIMASGTFGNRNQVTDGQATTTYNDPSGYRQQFTAKERDEESGLDYFGARYMASSQGRFTSADAPFLDQTPVDPQSWNLYAYVRNNPLRYVDPTGQAIQLLGETEEERHAQLEAIRASLVDSQVASQLSITGNDHGQFFVGIEGSVVDFQKAGDLESELGALIASEDTVEFGFSRSYTVFDEDMPMAVRGLPGLFGQTLPISRASGGVTNHGSVTASGNIQTLIDPSGLTDPQAARDGVPRSTLGEAVAHELLGHAPAHMQGVFGERNDARAIDVENRARARGGVTRGVKGPHLKNRLGF